MPIRPIIDTFRDIRAGKMMDELSVEMNELIQQIIDTGKKGELTLKLKIEPLKDEASMVSVKDEITIKAPRPDRGASLFYTTPEANLQRNDPNQRQIPGIVEVDKATGEIITPDQEPKPIKKA